MNEPIEGQIEEVDPFHNRPDPELRGGPDFGRFLEAVRLFQDRVVAIDPPPDVVAGLADQLDRLNDQLATWLVPEGSAAAGSRVDLPGRGNPMLVPFVVDEDTPTAVRGRVTFRRYHLGGHAAAHGGTLPLLFDDLLGRLSNAHDRPRARTAYLHVDYRNVTPLDTELRFEAWIVREEGRKRYLKGTLHDGDVLLAEAEGLFVVLLPGQP